MKVKVPVQDAWASRVSLLPPPPSSVVQSCWGGGGGWRAGSCLGILSREGGSLASQYHELKWRLILASKFGGLKSHINPASCHGGFFWRVISAHLFGGFSWQVNQAGFEEKQSKEKRSKLYTFREPLESHCKHCI